MAVMSQQVRPPITRILAVIALVIGVGLPALSSDAPVDPATNAGLMINLYWENAVQRAGRTEKLCLRIDATSVVVTTAVAQVTLPKGMALMSSVRQQAVTWNRNKVYTPLYSSQLVSDEKYKNATICWDMMSDKPLTGEVAVTVTADGAPAITKAIRVSFTKPVAVTQSQYVPRPIPGKTDYLIGAHYFPGWKPGTHVGWSAINPYPDRKPALGWYDESDPQVTDWEIKWALEHGINFFVYCWFREHKSLGAPVTQMLDHAIHDGLFKSKYGSMFKFAIMWENGNAAGVSSLNDLMNNLFPYWMTNYFKNPSYVLVDNKPVLFVYDFVKLKQSLGGPENVKKAIKLMNAECIKAGFSGLWVNAEYRGWDPWAMRLMASCGFDASFAYCWQNIPSKASDKQAADVQMGNMSKWLSWKYLPFVPTISMGWNPEPWITYCGYGYSPSWRLSPGGFEALCKRTKQMMDSLPENQLGHRMALLDNWNEFGEGHYITPTSQEGFGYLDAVRNVFTNGPRKHIDIVPSDVGLGPYDQAYLDWLKNQQKQFSEK